MDCFLYDGDLRHEKVNLLLETDALARVGIRLVMLIGDLFFLANTSTPRPCNILSRVESHCQLPSLLVH